MADIDESLHCLQTDTIDLYWLHRDDPKQPVAAILETLNTQVTAGKIRSFGCSNWQVQRIEEAMQYVTDHHKVYARTELRKRQQEFIALLSQLAQEIPLSICRISLVLNNLSVHKGKQVQTWLQSHPRFVCFFLPVHCSWMNQVEQWFSILQRKRLRILDFSKPLSSSRVLDGLRRRME